MPLRVYPIVRSSRFRDLEREVATLRSLLLPKVFSATGAYSARVYTRVISFRVLAHAEIEAFLEDRAREICLDAVKKFKTSRRITTPAAALLAFSGLTLEKPPEFRVSADPAKQGKLDEKLFLEKKLEKATASYFHLLSGNHGIKESNILSLLLPVGVDPASIDNVWLQTMNSFGSDRGIVAHSTRSSYGAMSLPDPRAEFQRIKDLLKGLRDIDTSLSKLLAE